ncbi:winged helix-turn-helix domain-containing protein [Photobacterium kishitanii]|uniref:winged helix-turn-helix domain-containing protein n=1 Tax=Photobacterium kishitanii TaxID=318456 RepID=UPI0005D39B16|nr:winged helix-turn-helix domain-containing protein [Photobacterium kishitanii]KJG11688.1 transcriptional regulator [Photobacterium kishitanii]OBU32117.1 transcriptional regulator [Photobacterium kishitanii]PSU23725.1 winged helix family transcriptional regulator [Photobacterium kishitanii]PSV04648.1 winged helix family transcriptional regulator [Photobacterium kishitanii]PSV16056.1 winged helix family transcriptional regulator [Photobacterium kishitanii]
MNDEVNDGCKRLGRFDVDFARRTITRISDGAFIKASRSETLIFTLLAESANNTIYREVLLAECWQGKIVTNNSLTVAIKNLRTAFSKIGENKIITTEPKLGYCIRQSALIDDGSHPPKSDEISCEEKNTRPLIEVQPVVAKEKVENSKKIKILTPRICNINVFEIIVGIAFFFATLTICYRFLFFIDTTSVEGLPVIYNGADLPKPVQNAILQNDNSSISRWYAFPINKSCNYYQLFSVSNDHFINYSPTIKQEICSVK